jgi:tungstate ABC transporter binding protein WtpA
MQGRWVVFVVVAVAVGLIAGYFIGYYTHPSSSSSTGSSNTTLSIIAAGTLTPLFPNVADQLVNITPGVSAPTASQTYEGSLVGANAIAQTGALTDVYAAADYRTIPTILQPKFANFEISFANTSVVLAYNTSVPAFSNLTTENWFNQVVQPGVVLGWPNASADPNGYNAIFALELQGILLGNESVVYNHFFSTPVGSLAVPRAGVTSIVKENTVPTLLKAGEISASFTYQAFAIAQHLRFVQLSPYANLGGLNQTDVTTYAKASTTVLNSTGGTQVVTGAPVIYSVTVPLNAPNDTLGAQFVNLLLSHWGAGQMEALGYYPIFPAWSNTIANVPSVVGGQVASYPAWIVPPTPG